MQFFTLDEFITKFPQYEGIVTDKSAWKIEAVSEMIFSQIGLRYRDTSWTSASVPLPIKQASMEQLRFMLEHDLPFVDIDKHLTAGEMNADIKSDYSTLALRILANHGYLYRGSPMNSNLALNIPFGE